MRRVGLAADHGGFELKAIVLQRLVIEETELVDFGATVFDPADDYPDYVLPLGRAVAAGEIARGIVICGSGVGACVASNKLPGVRAALIHDIFSAHQGVEDDDMNMICLGGRVTGYGLALDLIEAFLAARYRAEDRFERRLRKIVQLEMGSDNEQ